MELPELWHKQMRFILRFDEGVRYRPYDCGTGKLVVAPEGRITIGIGRNLQDKGITEATALQMLDEDIAECVKFAGELFTEAEFLKFSSPRQHAIISMIFNLGAGGFSQFKNTIELIKRGEWSMAAQSALLSKWARQVPLRARRVADMLGSERYCYPGMPK